MIKEGKDIEGSLNVGQIAPDFNLPNTDGRQFELATATADKPIVLVFYRGDW